MTCAVLCHLGIEERDIRLPGTRFDHAKHLGKAGDCSTCHSTGERGRPGADHGRTLLGAQDCAKCHHAPGAKDPAADRDCASCHAEEQRFLRGLRPDGSKGPPMMPDVACDSCHDSPPSKPVLAAVKPHCIECHEDEPEKAAALDAWVADAASWRAAAEARVLALRSASRGKGDAAAAAVGATEAVLQRLRLAVPVHNVKRFEEEKRAFDEAAAAAERAAR